MFRINTFELGYIYCQFGMVCRGMMYESFKFYKKTNLNNFLRQGFPFLIAGFMHSANAAFMQIIFCILANLGSVYLGYILYVILEDLCIVCVSTYIINFFLLVIVVSNYTFLARRRVTSIRKKKQ